MLYFVRNFELPQETFMFLCVIYIFLTNCNLIIIIEIKNKIYVHVLCLNVNFLSGSRRIKYLSTHQSDNSKVFVFLQLILKCPVQPTFITASQRNKNEILDDLEKSLKMEFPNETC